MFKIINDPGPDTNRFNDIRIIIQKISKSNRDTIRLLFLHFHDIIHQSNTISPTQTPSSKTSESSFIPGSIAQLIKSKERTVKYLIQHATDIFERPRTSSASRYVLSKQKKKNNIFEKNLLFRLSLNKNLSRSSLHCETIE